jgi:1,4-dihydroxy-2-naphthoate octaprenyltransferase
MPHHRCQQERRAPGVPLSVWVHAARPKTLPAALAPVLLGSACAAGAGGFQPVPALLAAAFALLVQITCNLANDHGDFKRGADTPERAGPLRVTAAGLVPPAVMRRAIALAAAAAFAAGFGLVFHGGWWLIGVGAVCLAACLAYTGGPFPLAYHGLGDVFVLVFFGFVAVLFTAYTQCGTFPPAAWFAGAGCGLLAVNILVVNNTRDMETDAKAGKRTLVVRFGRAFARGEYAANTVLALAMPPALWLWNRAPWNSATTTGGGDGGGDSGGCLANALLWLPLPATVALVFCAVSFCRCRPENRAEYNPHLGRAALALLLYALLFAGALLAGK